MSGTLRLSNLTHKPDSLVPNPCFFGSCPLRTISACQMTSLTFVNVTYEIDDSVYSRGRLGE